MGATLVQHPELVHAVVSFVGIYDMLRSELSPNGAFNVTEFGSVKTRPSSARCYDYSPYHHVVRGIAYPRVLLLTGENDPRVEPMQSRKMIARLQAAGAGGPFLLRTSQNAGHGGDTDLGRDRRADNGCDELHARGGVGAVTVADTVTVTLIRLGEKDRGHRHRSPTLSPMACLWLWLRLGAHAPTPKSYAPPRRAPLRDS